MEWIGAVLITIGIVSFQYVQLHRNRRSNIEDDDDDDGAGGAIGGDDVDVDGKGGGGGGGVGGDSPYGLALLGLSLLMDGVMAACQNALKRGDRGSTRSGRAVGKGRVKSDDDDDDDNDDGIIVPPPTSNRRRPPTAMETMMYINLYATLMLLPMSYCAGQFRRGMDALVSTDKSTLLLQLNLSASLGQVFVFLTIHRFNPLTCTTITTTRKFFTILLSVYKFGHVLGAMQWFSVALVFVGLYLEIAVKLLDTEVGGVRPCGNAKSGGKRKEE